ncbi:MAG: hypothetical protein PHI11_01790 [Gallionella sp.]|nr:hypothetical protein [Gallionella sp.]
MIGTIDFQYDTVNDIVIATPHWKIESQEECELWLNQYEAYFSHHFDRPMDMIFVLHDFTINSQIMTVWGEYRIRLITRYIRFYYLVHPKPVVNIASSISAIKYKNPSGEAESIAHAIAAIQADRISGHQATIRTCF